MLQPPAAQVLFAVRPYVIPVYDPDDRPRDVFSWADGVYVAEPSEWRSLRAAYREAWLALAQHH